jgi:dihydroorotase
LVRESGTMGDPPVMDSADLLRQNMTKGNALKRVNFIQIGALGHGLQDEYPVDFKAMRTFTPLFSNDGNTVWNERFMSDCLRQSKTLDFTICTHCQPESEIIRRDLALLKTNGGNLHICHVSTRESMELIRNAKQKGLRFTCEATPHHLFASELDYRVNPPFETEDDRQSLIEGMMDGTIDVLATDHAPHSHEDKENGSPGVDNIETAFQMYWHVFRINEISIRKLSELFRETAKY